MLRQRRTDRSRCSTTWRGPCTARQPTLVDRQRRSAPTCGPSSLACTGGYQSCPERDGRIVNTASLAGLVTFRCRYSPVPRICRRRALRRSAVRGEGARFFRGPSRRDRTADLRQGAPRRGSRRAGPRHAYLVDEATSYTSSTVSPSGWGGSSCPSSRTATCTGDTSRETGRWKSPCSSTSTTTGPVRGRGPIHPTPGST